MVDALQLAVDTVDPIAPANRDFWQGKAETYAVILRVDERPEYADNIEVYRVDPLKVDIWTKSTNPSGYSEPIRAALKSAGFIVTGGQGDAQVINQTLWYCVTLLAEYEQEVD
jgi:hypothetical protein